MGGGGRESDRTSDCDREGRRGVKREGLGERDGRVTRSCCSVIQFFISTAPPGATSQVPADPCRGIMGAGRQGHHGGREEHSSPLLVQRDPHFFSTFENSRKLWPLNWWFSESLSAQRLCNSSKATAITVTAHAGQACTVIRGAILGDSESKPLADAKCSKTESESEKVRSLDVHEKI